MSQIRAGKRILILCEGETEYFYAKALQMTLPREFQRSVSIEIDFDSRNDPKSLANEAKKRVKKARQEKNAFTEVWLFFDNDNWPQLKEAFEIIHIEKYKVAYSSMSMECWFILHYENCGKAFLNGEESLRYLKKLWPEYHKTKVKHFDYLKENISDAKSRSQILRKNSDPNLPIYLKNPYFTIDLLVNFFEQLPE